MKKLILAEALCGQTRLAVLEDGLLEEIYSESAEGERCVGNIYAGRVENVLPGMQAAFVNIGLEKNAYLSVADIPVDKSDLGIDEKDVLRNASIKTLLRPGQEILVQGIKEPGGTKGARISCHITLPGRYCVLMPTVDCVGVSRKITQAEERARLHDLADALRPQGMGIIVRTAAEHVEEAKLRDDIAAMLRLWGTIQTRQRYGVAPALLHRDLSLIYQAVRDMLAGEDVEMLIENEAQYRAAREVASMFSPECESRVRFYEGNEPLFEQYGIDHQMEKAYERRVWLKSGGYLVIDHAEALTAIDVNTGKFVGKHSFEETVFAINCEAAAEIAHQLRLRDVGGIVVIDFIDMELAEHREELLCRLQDALARDRAKIHLAGFTSLGLVELTRKRIQQPLYLRDMQPCAACRGAGLVLSPQAVAHKIQGDLRARVQVGEDGPHLIDASKEVSEALYAMGVPAERCYAHWDTNLSGAQYHISPAQESALPPKTRPLPRSENS